VKREPLFRVIVELFTVEWSERNNRAFLNEKNDDHHELIGILDSSVGIYAFYNSEMEIIYLGKTNVSLWSEMQSAFVRDMPHYKRYRVHHPRDKFKVTTSGRARKLQLQNMAVWEAASYFSAYAVQPDYVDDVEKLLIRVAPNDILNKRMEGNGSLDMHVLQEDE
jgi:hypothetical protein